MYRNPWKKLSASSEPEYLHYKLLTLITIIDLIKPKYMGNIPIYNINVHIRKLHSSRRYLEPLSSKMHCNHIQGILNKLGTCELLEYISNRVKGGSHYIEGIKRENNDTSNYCKISVRSIRSMVLLLEIVGDLPLPTNICSNGMGELQISWDAYNVREDATLAFNEDYTLRFLGWTNNDAIGPIPIRGADYVSRIEA